MTSFLFLYIYLAFMRVVNMCLKMTLAPRTGHDDHKPVRLKKSLVVDGVIRGLHEVAKHVEACKAQVAWLRCRMPRI